MLRRRFVLGSVGALAVARAAFAQAPRKMSRIGVLLAPTMPNSLMAAFQGEMRRLGYTEGTNVRIDYRSAEGRPERFVELAADLVRLEPDVIVAGGGTPAVRAAMKATSTIPIVFPASGDPVADGLVQSLARPGGNVTGLSVLTSAINAKRVQLVKELLPRAERLSVLQDPTMRSNIDQISAVEEAARALSIRLQVLNPANPEEYPAAFETAVKARADALIVLPSSSFNANRRRLLQLAGQHRLITIWEHRLFTEGGGLLSYGPDFADMYRGAARYVDRILKGAKPAELPVEQATKLELVINLQTAKALDLTVPGTLLVRADQVLQ